jgi:hypothetical protein
MSARGAALIAASRTAWSRHGRTIRLAGVIYLGIAAVGKTAHAIPRLVRDLEPWSALDLRYRYGEVQEWFAGNPVYGVVDGAVYPPASHVILWPFMGWVSLDGARVIWALTTMAAAGALAWLLYRSAQTASARNRLLPAGLALALYSLPICLYVGQMGMHVMAFAALGAALLVSRAGWGSDAMAAILLAAALVKPTVSIPLVVAAVMVGGRLRPAALVVVAYGVLTLAAGAFQPAGLPTLFRDWLAVASVRVPIEDGVPNLHLLMLRVGLASCMTPASLVALGAMAAWMWPRRTADPWVLLGIAALVSRFWAHSTLYDDALLLLPALALFRIAFRDQGSGRVLAGWLFAAAWAALLTPVWAYYSMGAVVPRMLHAIQAALWLGVLVFLMVKAWRTSP